jgi:nucleoside-diphosphate-sugar epimerase
VKADMAIGDFGDVPQDFDYVLNFAVVKTGDFDYDLAANGEGAGKLMLHCQKMKAFLHCSTTAVYEYAGHLPRKENSPLGDNHRSMFPTYSIAKIAAETVVRFVARQFAIPTTIARLSVPYGDSGGWLYFHLLMMLRRIPIPIHPDRPNIYNPIHVEDYISHIPSLLQAASKEATTVNWGGIEPVSIEEWCGYLAEITGLEPIFEENKQAFGSLQIDISRMNQILGPGRVYWQDGIMSMVRNLAPDLLKEQFRKNAEPT